MKWPPYLPTHLELAIFSHLLPEDLGRLSKVRKSWETTESDEVWGPFLCTTWGVAESEGGAMTDWRGETLHPPLKQAWLGWQKQFSGYPAPLVKRAHVFWLTLKAFLRDTAPHILPTLLPGVQDSVLDMAEGSLGFELSPVVRLLYRFHNGQSFGAGKPEHGIFGGYGFYDFVRVGYFLPLASAVGVSMRYLSDILQDSETKAVLLVGSIDRRMACDTGRGIWVKCSGGEDVGRLGGAEEWESAIRNDNNDNNGDDGDNDDAVAAAGPAVAVSPTAAAAAAAAAAGGGSAAVASGAEEEQQHEQEGGGVGDMVNNDDPSPLLQYLEEWVRRLTSGMYLYRPLWEDTSGLCMYPQGLGQGMFERSTRGVRIRVSTLWCAMLAAEEKMWAYRVSMRLMRDDPTYDGLQSVSLLSRYWRITDGSGRHSEVEGRGVIGKYPTLTPNDAEDFCYRSCTTLDVAPGSMGGHFVFRLAGGGTFQAIVPEFTLKLPRFDFAW